MFVIETTNMYDRKQLRKGTATEMEHVDPRWTSQHKKAFAERIAKAHLREFRSYYIVLPGAEQKMQAIDKSMKRNRR